jgi:peptidoglycan/LPS O-acetylase OafA/YrhL
MTTNYQQMELPVTERGAGRRLLSIDALRGLAALGVVAYHVVGAHPKEGVGGALSWAVMPFINAFSFGYVSVFLFFVISGFCIHMKWTRARAAGAESPSLQFAAFWKRRFRRLYPPYLLALALYLGIAALTSDVKITPLYIWDVVSHVFMLHNFDVKTVYSINGVFWTLAIEEQLYLAYFLLLFLRKRWGWTLALAVCFGARVGWMVLANWLKTSYGVETPLTEAAMTHWFTWALGAVGVEAAFGLIKLPAWCRNLWAGMASLIAAGTIAFILDHHAGGVWHDLVWLLMHPAWGLGFFIVVNAGVALEARWREKLRTPVLVTGLAGVGVFSYSLYLVHELVLMETWHFYFLGMSDTMTALVFTVPLSIGAAWIFFLVCERPFLTSKSSRLARTESASPALSNASKPVGAAGIEAA